MGYVLGGIPSDDCFYIRGCGFIQILVSSQPASLFCFSGVCSQLWVVHTYVQSGSICIMSYDFGNWISNRIGTSMSLI